VRRSPDPADNFLLALAEAGNADYLVTGDKSGLLALASHKSARRLRRPVRKTGSMNGRFPLLAILVNHHFPPVSIL
jgi:predicted nucleic acid-binding protein